jgi:uncharacterized protein YegP (UPF0339 family)
VSAAMVAMMYIILAAMMTMMYIVLAAKVTTYIKYYNFDIILTSTHYLICNDCTKGIHLALF